MMSALLLALLNDPDHFAAAFDGDHLVFRTMNRDSYARSLFLDGRIDSTSPDTMRVPIEPLMRGMREVGTQRRPLSFIFHIAHCGSTLLARALDDVALDLVLREPAILRQLGVLAARETPPPPQWTMIAELACSLLGKRYEPRAPVIVKGNVPVNFMLPWLLDRHPGTPAILLYTTFDDYLAAVLRSDDHRNWVQSISGELHAPLRDILDPLDALKPGRIAAALWLVQLRIFADALTRYPSAVALDAEQFFSRPAQTLQAACVLFGIPQMRDKMESVAAGPLFHSNAKNPDQPFDERARRQRREETRLRLSAEIDDARAWLHTKMESHPVPQRLSRSLLPGAGPLY